MTAIYFDESGDLGFDFSKKGTSNQFLVTFLIIKNKRSVSTLVKKTFKSLPSAIKRKNSGVLHAQYEKPSTVIRLLKGLARKEIQIASMLLNKRNMIISGNPNELYASIVISLINRLYADGVFADDEHVSLIASQRNTSKSLNNRFSESVVNNAQVTKFTVNILKPAEDKCLQAVDFVSWALWQKYTRQDLTFTNLIMDKILYEYEMYK
jgi:hypothetical protein